MKNIWLISFFTVTLGLISFCQAQPEMVSLIKYEKNRKFEIINMSFEKYLAGVIEAEMGSDFPLQAMFAQGLVSKAWYQKNHNRHQGLSANVCSLTHCQAWKKPSAKSLLVAQNLKNQSLENMPQHIFFSAACAAPQDFRQDRYLCSIFPQFKYDLNISISQFLKITSFQDVHQVSQDTEYLYWKSQKISKEVFFEKAVTQLGNQVLRSHHFQVEITKQEVKISGLGLGHGRGFCQWGAKALAQEGWAYQKILNHYFKNSLLKRSPPTKISIDEFIKLQSYAYLSTIKSNQFKISQQEWVLPPQTSAVFITFFNRETKKVRGCSGEFISKNFVDSNLIAKHLLRALKHDPRYPPILFNELPQLDFKISYLHDLKNEPDPYRIRPDKNGIVYESGTVRAILLPGEAKTMRWAILELRRQAGVKQVPTTEKFWSVQTRDFYFDLN